MPTQMIEAMVDLETVGVSPGCALLSIGVVMFDLSAKTIGPTFYQAIDAESCVVRGLRKEPDTAAWWSNQSVEARAVWEDPDKLPLEEGLLKLTKWMGEQADRKILKVWGNGASFDQPVLTAAFNACALQVPWIFKNEMCYRTMSRFLPEVVVKDGGVHHNALDDAMYQTTRLLKMFAARESEKPDKERTTALEKKFAPPSESVINKARKAVAAAAKRAKK